MQTEITTSIVKSLRPDGTRYTVWCKEENPAGFGIRVRKSGTKTYVLLARTLSGSQSLVTLGRTGTLSLPDARKAAWAALSKIQKGENPNAEKKALSNQTFGTLATLYMNELQTKRQGHQVEGYLRREWLGEVPTRRRITKDGRTFWQTTWSLSKDGGLRDKPAPLITREDILARLNLIRGTRGRFAARHALNSVRQALNWAAEFNICGVKTSPAAFLRDKSVGLTGKDMRRQRVLSDEEIRAVWRAAGDAGIFGILVKVMLLSAQRRADWREARYSELGRDGDQQLLTVPSARYKTGEIHEVPITPLMNELLGLLPRFAGSDYIFSLAGRRPITTSRLKKHLDEASGISGYTLHDLRRTARTRMAEIGVDDAAAERVLGHALSGVHKTYNVSKHRKQKRAAMEAWEAELLRIVAAPATGDNVISMQRFAGPAKTSAQSPAAGRYRIPG